MLLLKHAFKQIAILICFACLAAPIQSAGCSEFTRSSIIKEKLSGYKSDIRLVNITNYYTQILFESEMEYGLGEFDEPVVRGYNRKDPMLAFGLAFVPGFIVHGLGHFYIEDNSTGFTLFCIEIASVGMLAGASIIRNSQSDYNQSPGREKGDDNFFPDVLAMVSAGLFFGSWIHDFIVAPSKASKMNKESKSSFYIYPEIKQECVSLKLAYMWK